MNYRTLEKYIINYQLILVLFRTKNHQTILNPNDHSDSNQSTARWQKRVPDTPPCQCFVPAGEKKHGGSPGKIMETMGDFSHRNGW